MTLEGGGAVQRRRLAPSRFMPSRVQNIPPANPRDTGQKCRNFPGLLRDMADDRDDYDSFVRLADSRFARLQQMHKQAVVNRRRYAEQNVRRTAHHLFGVTFVRWYNTHPDIRDPQVASSRWPTQRPRMLDRHNWTDLAPPWTYPPPNWNGQVPWTGGPPFI